jgi:hypothetical protein
MNTPLLTGSQVSSGLVHVNDLNNTLAVHASKGLDAHDSEGVAQYSFTDSGGNSLSLLSLVLGGVQDGTGVPLKVYVPLAQNPVAIPQEIGTFTFDGLLFSNQDELNAGLETVIISVNGSSLSEDAKTAITSQLRVLTYGDVDNTFSWVVNAVTYTFQITVVTASGSIVVIYSP